jgi:hypothetical protein
MRAKEISRLKLQGKTNDEIYELAICNYSLFGKAFYGFKASKAEKQKMNRLWARILQTGKLNAKTSPHSSGK